MVAARYPEAPSFLFRIRERSMTIVSFLIEYHAAYQRKQATYSAKGVSLSGSEASLTGVKPFAGGLWGEGRPNFESLGSPVRSGSPGMMASNDEERDLWQVGCENERMLPLLVSE